MLLLLLRIPPLLLRVHLLVPPLSLKRVAPLLGHPVGLGKLCGGPPIICKQVINMRHMSEALQRQYYLR